MERFAQLQDIKLEVVRAPGYADRIPMLLRGEGDVIAAIFDTPDRREKVTFTAEVIPTHNVAVTLPPRAPVRRVEELREMKVGVIRGAKPAEAAAEAGVKPKDLVAYEKMEDLLRGLKEGEVGAAVLPISELALASKRVAGLEAGITVGAPGTVAWAVRQEDTALRVALEDYLATCGAARPEPPGGAVLRGPGLTPCSTPADRAPASHPVGFRAPPVAAPSGSPPSARAGTSQMWTAAGGPRRGGEACGAGPHPRPVAVVLEDGRFTPR